MPRPRSVPNPDAWTEPLRIFNEQQQEALGQSVEYFRQAYEEARKAKKSSDPLAIIDQAANLLAPRVLALVHDTVVNGSGTATHSKEYLHRLGKPGKDKKWTVHSVDVITIFPSCEEHSEFLKELCGAQKTVENRDQLLRTILREAVLRRNQPTRAGRQRPQYKAVDVTAAVQRLTSTPPEKLRHREPGLRDQNLLQHSSVFSPPRSQSNPPPSERASPGISASPNNNYHALTDPGTPHARFGVEEYSKSSPTGNMALPAQGSASARSGHARLTSGMTTRSRAVGTPSKHSGNEEQSSAHGRGHNNDVDRQPDEYPSPGIQLTADDFQRADPNEYVREHFRESSERSAEDGTGTAAKDSLDQTAADEDDDIDPTGSNPGLHEEFNNEQQCLAATNVSDSTEPNPVMQYSNDIDDISKTVSQDTSNQAPLHPDKEATNSPNPPLVSSVNTPSRSPAGASLKRKRNSDDENDNNLHLNPALSRNPWRPRLDTLGSPQGSMQDYQVSVGQGKQEDQQPIEVSENDEEDMIHDSTENTNRQSIGTIRPDMKDTLPPGNWITGDTVMFGLRLFNPDSDRIYVREILNIQRGKGSQKTRGLASLKFSHELIIIPIWWQKNHYMISVVDRIEKTVQVFDPLRRSNNRAEVESHIFDHATTILRDPSSENGDGWRVVPEDSNLQQPNFVDCGIYAIVFGALTMHAKQIPDKIEPDMWRHALAASMSVTEKMPPIPISIPTCLTTLPPVTAEAPFDKSYRRAYRLLLEVRKGDDETNPTALAYGGEWQCILDLNNAVMDEQRKGFQQLRDLMGKLGYLPANIPPLEDSKKYAYLRLLHDFAETAIETYKEEQEDYQRLLGETTQYILQVLTVQSKAIMGVQ